MFGFVMRSVRATWALGTLAVLPAVVLALLGAAQTALGHHSFAATYHEDVQVEIEGSIVQFLFRNPHSFVHVDAPDDTGTMRTWIVEWGAAGALSNQGVNVGTLKVGDSVVVMGNSARDPGDFRIRMLKITRNSDGFVWGRPGQTFD